MKYNVRLRQRHRFLRESTIRRYPDDSFFNFALPDIVDWSIRRPTREWCIQTTRRAVRKDQKYMVEEDITPEVLL